MMPMSKKKEKRPLILLVATRSAKSRALDCPPSRTSVGVRVVLGRFPLCRGCSPVLERARTFRPALTTEIRAPEPPENFAANRRSGSPR